MPIGSITSMALAATAVVLTASVIAGTVTMVIIFQIETEGVNMTAPPTISTTTEGPPPAMRLPKNLIPERYEVFIQPHLYSQIIEVVNETSPNQTMLFTGYSTVYFNCFLPTKSIYLHSRNQVISNPMVKEIISRNEVKVDSFHHHTDGSDFLEIKLRESLKLGHNYSLYLEFSGDISENLEALYVSTYTKGVPSDVVDPNSMRYLAATDLEPTDARKVFPCFDEPEMKAEFDVAVQQRKSMSAIGNAAIADRNVIDVDWELTKFHTTPKMSTYLFAIVVSELKEKCTVYEHQPVTMCIHARPAAIEAGHTEYAESISRKILDFYNGRFGITYRLNKLDQVALPDLNPAAMENWGLVTYQEAGLLYEEGVSSLLHKEVIATLIAHELAHQWFGNLVTMKWWNQIWLNEGFASYMSYFAVDYVEPTFEIEDVFIMSDLHTAFEEDALASSHPLSVPQDDIQRTYEIIEMFDTITYSKGAIVLRMLADVITQTTFNKGINSYLKAFALQNTDQNDLWEYIQKAVQEDGGNTDVAEMMDTWTNQVGYPVVTINTTSGVIYQKHFLFNDTAESRLMWHIPIRVMSNISDASPVPDWLTMESATKDPFQSKKGEWILANVNCTGYYRVNYDPDNWQRLLNQLTTNPNRIPVMNRGQLVDDAFNLARAKMVNVTLALNFTQFLVNETAYLPWESAVRNLKYFVLMFDRSEVYGPMQTYLRHQVEGLYDFFSNYTDNNAVPQKHSLQHNQITAIDVACSNGLPACLEMTTRLYGDWMKPNSTNKIHSNLRSVIYCQAVAQGGKKEWEFAWEKFQSSSETSEKEQLRVALSCTKKTWLLNRYLEYTLNPEKIRLMDVASTINYIANNAAGQALAWNFIRAHWDYVSLGDGAMLIEGVTRRFSTQFELEELERFNTTYELGPANAAVHQAIEQTQVNIQWVREHQEIVLDWFEKAVKDYDL
ncbi:alanyl (membrane) aminopeptidase-like b [Scomber scombrus]|uniref:alanyl (membrane) aminopeptidase-like b n=1 Tax=Scomber scombrus TaxID=13677 RepID=UPI002DDC3464|nr:alanyl (membrane) aminopeptidase-like b [Scomber scombrus]